MHKEIKRLTLLSQCTHLSKTDRDACNWAIQQIEPPVVELDKGFDGFDFSSWPSVPDRAIFTELVKSRKAKKSAIMTQAWIDSVGPHMAILKEAGITVNQAIQVAAANGWQGLKAKWVINELQGDIEPSSSNEITIHNVMTKIKNGEITEIRQIPSAVRSQIESDMRFGRISNPKTITAFESIGFIL